MKKIFIFIALIILITLILPEKYPLDLGNRYSIDYDGRDDHALFKQGNRFVIEGHILDYAFNNNYIAAKQRPRAELKGCGIGDGYDSCKKAFEESTFFQYWIINKASGEKFGPFSLEAYTSKLEELGITNDEFLNL